MVLGERRFTLSVAMFVCLFPVIQIASAQATDYGRRPVGWAPPTTRSREHCSGNGGHSPPYSPAIVPNSPQGQSFRTK